MTTRSVVRDLRTPVSSACGNGHIGFYFAKTQSGGNRTLLEPIDTPHAYNMSQTQYFDTNVQIRFYWNPNKVYQCPVLVAGWGPSYDVKWNENAQLTLLNKLRGKMNGGDFHLGVTIAESKELWGTIALQATRVRRGLNSLLRGDLDSIPRNLGWKKAITNARKSRGKKVSSKDIQKDLSSKWLEYSYAWMPALNDAYNAGTKMAHLWADPSYFSVRASHQVRSKATSSTIVYQQSQQIESKQIIARFQRPGITTALGLQDPATVLWEKLPYSFVADWFIPIGSYLANQSYFNSIAQAQYIETFYKTQMVKGLVAVAGAEIVGGSGSSFYRTDVQVNRTVSNNIAVPLPAIKPLSSILGWQHCVSAVALLTNRFLK